MPGLGACRGAIAAPATQKGGGRRSTLLRVKCVQRILWTHLLAVCPGQFLVGAVGANHLEPNHKELPDSRRTSAGV